VIGLADLRRLADGIGAHHSPPPEEGGFFDARRAAARQSKHKEHEDTKITKRTMLVRRDKE
jgi:hypothetical protein